jgi:hypothetical protein
MGKAEELFWRCPTQNIDLRSPTRQDLKVLRDPAMEMAIAKELVDGSYAVEKGVGDRSASLEAMTIASRLSLSDLTGRYNGSIVLKK